MTIRAVVDTNVVVSGLLAPSGKPASVIRAAGVSFRLVWSPGVVAECLRVIDYPRVARILKQAGRHEQAREVVRALAAGADMVAEEMLPRVAVVEADPDDDLLLATALSGGASVVVSGDRRHLLSLGEFAGVRVIDPATFLVEIDPLASVTHLEEMATSFKHPPTRCNTRSSRPRPSYRVARVPCNCYNGS